MPRMTKVHADEGEWSNWISPQMNQPYRMGCCDCGLVHDVSFRVKKLTKRVGKGLWQGKPVSGMKVQFRARKNNRSTAQLRRKAR